MEVQLLHGLARQMRWIVANSPKKTAEESGNS